MTLPIINLPYSSLFGRLERLRSQSFDEDGMEATNRRQLPNVPKKPVRQSSSSRDNREPTPDYDSTGDKGIKNTLFGTIVLKCS